MIVKQPNGSMELTIFQLISISLNGEKILLFFGNSGACV